MFRNCEARTLIDLLECMAAKVYLPKEYILLEGSKGRHMCPARSRSRSRTQRLPPIVWIAMECVRTGTSCCAGYARYARPPHPPARSDGANPSIRCADIERRDAAEVARRRLVFRRAGLACAVVGRWCLCSAHAGRECVRVCAGPVVRARTGRRTETAGTRLTTHSHALAHRCTPFPLRPMRSQIDPPLGSVLISPCCAALPSLACPSPPPPAPPRERLWGFGSVGWLALPGRLVRARPRPSAPGRQHGAADMHLGCIRAVSGLTPRSGLCC
jgi:hypothetical protein